MLKMKIISQNIVIVVDKVELLTFGVFAVKYKNNISKGDKVNQPVGQCFLCSTMKNKKVWNYTGVSFYSWLTG